VQAERHLTIDIGDLSGLPRVQADTALLLKVFQNVIVNAIKYTPDGGRVTISGQKTAR